MRKIGYKFIQSDMKSKNGNITWKLGKWQKHEGEIELCKNGFHACLTPKQTLDYVYGDKWFIVEARGKILHKKDDKFVASEMRLVKEIDALQVLKRWALWNAKQCLKNYTAWNKDDTRVADCIRVCEEFLDGKATIEQVNAARSAAESAAWSAARSAAEKELNRLVKKYTIKEASP